MLILKRLAITLGLPIVAWELLMYNMCLIGPTLFVHVLQLGILMLCMHRRKRQFDIGIC